MTPGRQFIPGQMAIPVGDKRMFKGKEVDRHDSDFHQGPSAHVDDHGFIRDNTVTNRKAYTEVRTNHDLFDGKMVLEPHTQIHTLQAAGETSRNNHKDPSLAETNPVRVVKVRGAHVLVDGHHRVAAARKAGQPIEAQIFDADQKKFGMPLHELHGI